MKRNKLNFTFKVVEDSKTIDKCQTHSKRRFYNKIGTINWQNKPSKVYLRVSYGKRLSNYNRLENFYNDGEYQTKQELLEAFTAFTE